MMAPLWLPMGSGGAGLGSQSTAVVAVGSQQTHWVIPFQTIAAGSWDITVVVAPHTVTAP